MKFSIVTPAFNSERFIAETMESVVSQEGDFQIEYIVADGGSTDGTVEIIKACEERVGRGEGVKCKAIDFKWFSEKDRGMYDAINRGFARATGDIYAWLNSDDIYLPGALNIVSRAFERYPQVKWLKGTTSFIDEDSARVQPGQCKLYNRDWIRRGIYGRDAYWIEQDSVFWAQEAWKKVGGIDPGLKLAGDFYLWSRFAEFMKLYTLRADLSSFRMHKTQLSKDLQGYFRECDRVIARGDEGLREKVKRYFAKESKIPLFLRPILYRLTFGRQDLSLLELEGDEIVLKKKSYYRM